MNMLQAFKSLETDPDIQAVLDVWFRVYRSVFRV